MGRQCSVLVALVGVQALSNSTSNEVELHMARTSIKVKWLRADADELNERMLASNVLYSHRFAVKRRAEGFSESSTTAARLQTMERHGLV